MQVYRRSLWIMLKGIIMAPCAAVVAYFILNIFINNTMAVLGIPALIFIALIYMAIISENIRFELEPNGTMRYFKKGKLRKIYNLEEYLIGYRSQSDGAGSDITLHIVHAESGTEEHIDCSPIGSRKFSNMYTQIKSYSKEEPEVLKAK